MVKGILRDWLGVTELQESQKVDTEHFEEVFTALNEWKKEWQKVSSALDGKSGIEHLQSMQEHLSHLQVKFGGLEEKVETLADIAGGQEQVILTCAIVSAVAAMAVATFVTFCIYQGVKLEKKNELLQDTPNPKFNNMCSIEELKSNSEKGALCQ